ncbi:uncharacterized protein A4U43_C09F15340 [Asparagus officinalis]|uniref:C2 domain-containing protein n=1 Tax=Asparagus officinalis TaxID=4686 RepID=A0A5P1E7W3_ASPOF|nr:uncharacterized protein A4U43_C09F15340 [Asparagus officinalis]
MDRTSIDLRSISCSGVKSFSLFQKPSLSAAVSIAGQKKRTRDPDGAGTPEWPESFRFEPRPQTSAVTAILQLLHRRRRPRGPRCSGCPTGRRRVQTSPCAEPVEGGSDGSRRARQAYRGVEGTDREAQRRR